MQFREALLPTVTRNKIDEIVESVLHEPARLTELYILLDDADPKVAYKAAWVCNKLCKRQVDLLLPLWNEFVKRLLRCKHSGTKRLLLSIVNELPSPGQLHIELLDFCLQAMLSSKETSANRALCMKLAYKLCIQQSELLSELQAYLENTDPYYMPKAVRSTRNNTLLLIAKRMKQINRQ